MGILKEAKNPYYQRLALGAIGALGIAAGSGWYVGSHNPKLEYIPYTPGPIPTTIEQVGLDPLYCDGTTAKSQSYLIYVEEGQVNKIFGHNVYVDDNALRIVDATENPDDNIPAAIEIGNYHYYYLDVDLPTHRNAELFLSKEFFTKPASYGINMNVRCVPGEIADVPFLPAVQDAKPTEERDLTPARVSEVFKKVRDLISK